MSRKEEEIDYRPEGRDDGHPKKSPTDEGYDEAAHSGKTSYGVTEGSGGVFGTTGGGTYASGMHPVDPELPEESEETVPIGPVRKQPAVSYKTVGRAGETRRR